MTGVLQLIIYFCHNNCLHPLVFCFIFTCFDSKLWIKTFQSIRPSFVSTYWHLASFTID